MDKLCFVKLALPWQYDHYSDPPLGMLSVASAIRKSNLLEVSLFDMAHETKIPKADFYAFSASTLEYPEAVENAGKIKKKFPETKILAGGPHFDILPLRYWEKEIQDLPFNIICRGEGEVTIGRAIDFAKNSREKAVITQNGSLLNLDSLALPARDLLDKDKYFQNGKTFGIQGVTKGTSATIMISRGCPYTCSFCASPKLHKGKVRFRNFDNVKKELESMVNAFDVSELRWQDDNIPLNFKKIPILKDYLHEFGFKSRGSARTDTIIKEPEILNNLWYAGFREIGFGVESAENKILNLLNKRTNIQINEEALKRTKEIGFRTRAFIMTGLPGETKDSAKYMIDFLDRTNPDVVTLTSFVPLPGCDIYNNPEKYGVEIKSRNWSKYNIAITRESRTPWTHTISTATPKEMEINREMLKEFLFNRKMSNVHAYNKHYNSDVLEKES